MTRGAIDAHLRRLAAKARNLRRKAQNGDPFGRMETVAVMTAIEAHAKMARSGLALLPAKPAKSTPSAS